MGHKVHPFAFRLGSLRTWQSRWFSGNKKEYKKFLHEDIRIKQFLTSKTDSAGVARIDIHRSTGEVTAIIHTSKPGVLIGHSGGTIDKLRDQLRGEFPHVTFDLKVSEIRKPDMVAKLVAENIARQIEKRISYRRAAKAAMQRTIENGGKGIKIIIGGRLGGAEIARTETFRDGNVPLHTIRADIDYAHEGARTKFGMIGIRVWIFRGLVFGKQYVDEPEVMQSAEELKGGSLINGSMGGGRRRMGAPARRHDAAGKETS